LTFRSVSPFFDLALARSSSSAFVTHSTAIHFVTKFHTQIYTTEWEERVREDKIRKMASITQLNDVEELLQEAELADREFAAEKQNSVVLFNSGFSVPTVTEEQVRQQRLHWNTLTVPRR
jgi:hypothetical protein